MENNGVRIERSKRLDGIGEYYFSRRLREIAEIEAATGRRIIKLAMGSPDLPPAPCVVETLCETAHRPDVHRYMSYRGEPILRRAFADWYRRWYRVELDPETEVLPLLGSKEGIMHVCMAFLDPGRPGVGARPGIPHLQRRRAARRRRDRTLSPRRRKRFPARFLRFGAGCRRGEVDVRQLSQHAHGRTPTPELFSRLVDFGRRQNILIVHDNPYSFVRNDSRPFSILEVEGAREVALELNSLSKGHSMAGWRVGVAVGRREWLDAILTFKSNMDTGMFYPVQAAAAEALSLGEAWFDELNAIYREREKAGSKLLDTLGCTYRPHQAGLFIWARLPDAFIGDCYDFSDMVLDRCDVFLTPGGIFGSQGLRYIRITLCYPAEVLEEAAQRIRERLHR